MTAITSDDPIAGSRIVFVVNVDWFFLSHRLPLAGAVHHVQDADVLDGPAQ